MAETENTRKKLSPRQIRFIEFYCSGMSATEAYRKAGFGIKIENYHTHASQLMAKSSIREAINEKMNEFVTSVEDAIKQTAMQAFETEKGLMLTAENEFARIKASQDILDRAGLKPTDKVDQKHSGSVRIEFEYFDSPQETDDITDDNEAISE